MTKEIPGMRWSEPTPPHAPQELPRRNRGHLLQIRVQQELLERIRAQCDRHGLTMQQVGERAIQIAVEKLESTQPTI